MQYRIKVKNILSFLEKDNDIISSSRPFIHFKDPCWYHYKRGQSKKYEFFCIIPYMLMRWKLQFTICLHRIKPANDKLIFYACTHMIFAQQCRTVWVGKTNQLIEYNRITRMFKIQPNITSDVISTHLIFRFPVTPSYWKRKSHFHILIYNLLNC